MGLAGLEQGDGEVYAADAGSVTGWASMKQVKMKFVLWWGKRTRQIGCELLDLVFISLATVSHSGKAACK